MNFYAGNDAGDTKEYFIRKKYYNKYFPSFFREITRLIQRTIYWKQRKGSTHIKNIASIPDLPLADTLITDNTVYSTIQSAVRYIHSINPSTKIILSYIPATGSCYASPGTAYRNITILENWAKELNIYFVSPLEELRRFAKDEIIYNQSDNPHFNERGYEIYSQVLAKKIAEIKQEPEN